MSADFTLSKVQISKIIQSVGFLGSLSSKLAGPLMKVAVALAKYVWAVLGISAAASAIDVGIQKEILRSGRLSSSTLRAATLAISKKEMNYTIQILQALKILLFYWKESLKQLKTKQKKEDS